MLSYWKAEKGKVPVQNDCFSICSTTKKPVLAHLFLNFMLDNGVSYENFVDFNGYQPPLNEIDPARWSPTGSCRRTWRTASSRTTTSAPTRCST